MSDGPNWPLTIFVLLVVVAGIGWFVRIVVAGVRAAERTAAEARRGPEVPALWGPAEPASADDDDDSLPEKVEQVNLNDRESVDLRELPSVRMVIRGAGNWIGYGAGRAVRFDSAWYALLREPSNRHDGNAIAVHHPNGRKVGFVSRTRAEGMAPLLDQIGPAAFVVTGGLDEGRLRVDIPSLPALRAFVKRGRLG